MDVAKDGVDVGMLKSYGSVIDTGTGTVRLFIYESQVKELSEFAVKKNLSFTVSPITLDDVFIAILGSA